MSIDDVLPVSSSPNAPLRFTSHYFVPDDERDRWPVDPLDLRYPLNLNEGWPEDWPPSFLWDFIYGIIIAEKYGNRKTVGILNEESNSQYYPEGVNAAEERARNELARRKRERDQKMEDQKNVRDDVPDIYDQVLCLWAYHLHGPLGQETCAKEEAKFLEAEQEERRLRAEEVVQWRKGLEEAAD